MSEMPVYLVTIEVSVEAEDEVDAAATGGELAEGIEGANEDVPSARCVKVE